MSLKFIAGKPAAAIGTRLIVSDVHLGIEFEMQRKGVRQAPDPAKIAREMKRLASEHGADSLIVLGDFKHDVRGFEEREKKVVREFLSALAMPVTVVKGNHDSLLENFQQLTLAPAGGIVIRDGKTKYGLFHGHAWPDPQLLKTSTLLLGNLHPLYEFRDGMGGVYREKVWLSGKIGLNAKNRQVAELKGAREGQKFIVFPAYCNLAGGAAVNGNGEPRHIGPLFRHGLIDLEKTGATLLNGVKVR